MMMKKKLLQTNNKFFVKHIKKMSILVKRSAQLSLFLQFVSGVANVLGFFLTPSANLQTNEVNDVKIIMAVETSSQFIEFLYYLVAVFIWNGIIDTWTRYIDWFISTPIMLVSTAMFFSHRRMVYSSEGDMLDIFTDWKLYVMISLNTLMLIMGFCVELKVLPEATGNIFGACALVGSFTMMAFFVPKDDEWSTPFFYTMYGVWFLYGLAAILPKDQKNTSYNLLDVVAKNFYGVFLLLYLLYV